MEIIPFIIFILIFAALAYYNHLSQQKRREALKGFAGTHGLSFAPEKDTLLAQQFSFFPIFARGENRYAFNVLKGAYQNRNILAFDYHYSVTTQDSKGRRQTQHFYLSAALWTLGFPVKSLSIRPEGFLDKVSGFLGLTDINFESAEFSKKFFVTARDKKFAYDVIHQGMMEFLLSYPQRILQMDRTHLLVCQQKIFTPQQLAQSLELGSGIIDRIPEYLIKELKETSGAQP